MRESDRQLKPLLEWAIAYAVEAHRGQTDLGGEPYILHALRVMEAGATYAQKIVGVLHDVIEDCGGWGAHSRLTDALEPVPGLLEALEAITKRPHEPYARYIRRVATDPLARPVKIADLHDNSAPWRVVSAKQRRRHGRRYPAALKYLRAAGG